MNKITQLASPAAPPLIDDVREPDDYAAGRAVGATNLPMASLPTEAGR